MHASDLGSWMRRAVLVTVVAVASAGCTATVKKDTGSTASAQPLVAAPRPVVPAVAPGT